MFVFFLFIFSASYPFSKYNNTQDFSAYKTYKRLNYAPRNSTVLKNKVTKQSYVNHNSRKLVYLIYPSSLQMIWSYKNKYGLKNKVIPVKTLMNTRNNVTFYHNRVFSVNLCVLVVCHEIRKKKNIVHCTQRLNNQYESSNRTKHSPGHFLFEGNTETQWTINVLISIGSLKNCTYKECRQHSK